MSVATELIKLQRVRRAFIRFAREINQQGTWIGALDRRYGKIADAAGDVPIIDTVESFGSFTSALVNYEFPLEIPSTQSMLNDPTREWALLGDRPSNQLIGRRLEYWLRQETDTEEILDLLIAQGRITKPSYPTPGRRVNLNVTVPNGDYLGDTLGRRLLTAVDWPRSLPDDRGKVIPMVIGSLTNAVQPVILIDDPGPTPTCACDNPTIGDEIWTWAPQSTVEWATNDAFGWSWGAPGYPDNLDPYIRTTLAAKRGLGDGPAGENTIQPDFSGSNDGASVAEFTPKPTADTVVSGNATKTWTGWDAQKNRFSFDIKIDSTIVASIISQNLPGGGTNGTGLGLVRVIGDTQTALITLSFPNAGPFAGSGLGVSGSNLITNIALSWGSLSTLTAYSLPMDVWLHFEWDWGCGTITPPSTVASDGCTKISFTPAGGVKTLLFNRSCTNLRFNTTTSLSTYADAGGGAPLTQPGRNYVGRIQIGSPLIGPYTNLRLDAVDSYSATAPLEETEDISATTTSCSDSGDLGSAGRGGFIRGLLVDTGGAETNLSDYPKPTGLTASVQNTGHAAPTISGTLATGGNGIVGQSFYYAAVTMHAGQVSELSSVIGPFTIDDAHRRVTLTFSGLASGADAIRVYRSQLNTFEQYDRYRYVTGYKETDIPAAVTSISDEWPGVSTRDQLDPDPMWDLNYRRQKYYQVSATYADGKVSACTDFVQVNTYPRNGPLRIKVDWTAPTGTLPAAVTGYTVRRASQTYHYDIGLDRQWDVNAFTITDDVDEQNSNTTPVQPCASSSTGTGTGTSKPRYAFAGHTLKRIREVFVLKPDPASETNEFVQVLMTEGTDYTQEVVERNGNRYHTIVFNQQQRSETCQYYEVSANVDGADYNANGSGDLIVNADDVFEWFMLNVVFNTYRSSIGPYAPSGGKWFTDVPYAPGLLNHASVLTAKAVGATLVEGGLLAAGALTELIGVPELIQQLLTSFGLSMTQYNGVWYVRRSNPRALDRDDLESLGTNTGEVAAESFETDIDDSRLANEVAYFAGPLSGSTGNNGYVVSGLYTDAESLDVYKERISGKEPIYLRWTQDAVTARIVVRMLVDQFRFPVITPTFRGPVSWYARPVGTEFLMNSPDGIGINGWNNRAVQLIRVELSLDTLSTVVTIRDIDDLVPQ